MTKIEREIKSEKRKKPKSVRDSYQVRHRPRGCTDYVASNASNQKTKPIDLVSIKALNKNELYMRMSDESGNDSEDYEVIPASVREIMGNADRRITINVGGTHFETFLFTIMRYPTTRLAKELYHYKFEVTELFFDHDALCFHFILNFYRTNRLHTPLFLCGPLFQEELSFWEIDWNYVEPCCRNQLLVHNQVRDIINNLNEKDEHLDAIQKDWLMNEKEAACSYLTKEFKKIWHLLEYPSTETLRGKIVTLITVGMVLISLALVTMESLPAFRDSKSKTISVYELANGPVSHFLENTRPKIAMEILQIAELVYFISELSVRFAFSPCKVFFFSKLINWIDMIAFTTTTSSKLVEFWTRKDLPPEVIFFCKLPRILRVFKLATHMQELQVLSMSLKASYKELRLLAIIVMMFVVLWGVLAYSLELMFESVTDLKGSRIKNVLIGYWWALVTMTTVGYGDIVLNTIPGYMVGAVCSLCGVLVIALPIPIVVNNFNLLYSHHRALIEEKGSRNKKGDD